MTWTGWMRVVEVDGSTAVARADVEEQVKPYPSSDATVAAVTSNTEGRITSIELRLSFDGDASLAVGDLVTATGHFESGGRS